MTKHLYFLALLLLTPFVATAQDNQISGEWTLHANVSTANITNVVDAGSKVYSLISKRIISYDKATGVMTNLTTNEGLNGVNVTQIAYYPEGQYLLVVYDDANMDVIDQNGNIKNLPQIKNGVMPDAKIINDINFAGGKIAIATGFGYVIYDAQTLVVESSVNFHAGVTSATVVGNTLLLTTADGTLAGTLGSYYNSLSQFATISTATGKLCGIDNTHYFLTESARFSLCTLGGEGESATVSATQVVAAAPKTVQRTPTGFVASFTTTNGYYTFNADGSGAKKNTGTELYSTTESGNWWALSGNGLVHVVGGVKGTPIALDGYGITTATFWVVYDQLANRMLLTNSSNNKVLTSGGASNSMVYAFNGEHWTDLTNSNYSSGSGNQRPVASPVEQNVFYVPKFANGLYKVNNNTLQAALTNSNSALGSNYAAQLAFDSHNNLWAVNGYGAGTKNVSMITPENQRAITSTATSTASLWRSYDVQGVNQAAFWRGSFAIGKDDNKVYSSGNWGKSVVIWNNDDATFNLKQRVELTTLKDTQGANHSWSYIKSLKADRDGIVWMGTDAELYSFDPTEAYGNDFRVRYIDYTFGDFTFPSKSYNAIAVDALNRKWIGTNSDGVIVLNAEGTEVLAQFKPSNSQLPSNQIYDMDCNLSNNHMFIVTQNGVVEFAEGEGGSTSQEFNIKNVYVTPALVEPDFTAMVEINGLPAGCPVQIVNNAGTVVATLTAGTSGTALWDAADTTGNRVATGNYRVKATVNGNELEVALVRVIK